MYEEHKEYTRNMILHMLSCCVVSYIYIYIHAYTNKNIPSDIYMILQQEPSINQYLS